MTTPARSESEPSASSVEFTLDKVGDLLEQLCDASAKWYFIGIGLEVPTSELDRIKTEQGTDNTKGCLLEVLKVVLTKGPVRPTTVAKVLRRHSVLEPGIADKLEPNEFDSKPDTTRPSTLPFSKTNVLHRIAPNISEEIFPYTKFKNKYPTHVPFGLFIVFQILSMLCDKVFRPAFTSEEYVNRVVFFVMRAFLMVVLPSVCYAQLCYLGRLEKRFHKKTPDKDKEPIDESDSKLQAECGEAVQKIFQDRKVSINPIKFVKEVVKIFKLNGIEITDFQVLIHAVVLPVFLFYLGVFHSRHSYQPLPVGAMPIWRQRLQVNGIQLLEVWDCIAISIILIFSGILKDLYSFENQLATLVSETESSQSLTKQYKKIFRAIRERWLHIDVYLHMQALLLAFLTLVLIYHGEPFTPKYVRQNFDEQNIWNILTVIITIMQLGGSSANPDFKALSIVGYFAIPLITSVFIYIVGDVFELDLNQTTYSFHFTPGNTNLLLYTTQAVSLINWLLCLFHCYWRQSELKTRSYHFCLLSLTLVSLSLSTVAIREFKYVNNDNCTCACDCS